MPNFVSLQVLEALPRLPLIGNLDLTYRCNFDCRHCWVRISPGASERLAELNFAEFRAIVDQARSQGCREWSISGGEPMLRPDFAEIFDYITRKAGGYTLNTNGSLVTPPIAQLMRRPGSKMVALYGATAEVFDHITRTPDSFEKAMQGFAYLREAGATFTVQLIPMRDNYHQLDAMRRLAEDLSTQWRIGAPWLYLRADGDPVRNAEIRCQRVEPREVIELEGFGSGRGKPVVKRDDSGRSALGQDGRIFASCLADRREFHIDPYGAMSMCAFIKDPALRYDLRTGSFSEAWETFIPALAEAEPDGSPEYLQNCGGCELRCDCQWCPGKGYLEHRRSSARMEYLCAVARETKRSKEMWDLDHRRYYRIGGLTLQVEGDLPITDVVFAPKFEQFQVEQPGDDLVCLRHHFFLPQLSPDLGQEVYSKPPWAIYRKGDSWIYLGSTPDGGKGRLLKVAVFNHDHTQGDIYHQDDKPFRLGGLTSLTGFSTDQILLARVLADHQGCFLHSSGTILDGQGLLFVGHSGAGKSTMVQMLIDRQAEVLTDDRNIVRRWPDGFWVHSSWSHGLIPLVSASSAPLAAILFLEQATENRLVPIEDRREIVRRLLGCMIKPLQTADWWEKMLDLAATMAREVPCYRLRFAKDPEVLDLLPGLVRHSVAAELPAEPLLADR